MGRINFFSGAVGRTLQVTLLRFQPTCLIQELRAPISSVANPSLLFKSSGDKLFRECSLIAWNSSSKGILLNPNRPVVVKTCLRHTSPLPAKEAEARNFASSVVEPKPTSNEDEKLRQQSSEEWKEIRPNYSIKPYLSLAKIKLTSFVMMTAMAGYAAAPGAFHLPTFLSCSAGVLLTSSAANTINQIFEVPYDSQMSRTMNRPLVKGLVTPQQAMAFAGLSSSVGVLTLLCGANALTAVLGLSNILIYTLMYTPMKRTNIANTWVGSIVGALPPMMGWVAATGHLDAGAWLLGGVLFAWQFPHFCALSWNLQSDYSRAGYRMMSVVNPDLCKKVALRYSLVLTGLTFLFPICDVTSWPVAFCSLPINGYLNYLSWQFYSNGDSSSARKLFKFSLVYLPLVLILLIAGKKQNGTENAVVEKDVHEA